MATSSKRKNIFILGFFAVLAVVVLVLMNVNVPAPVAERTIELDAANVLRK